jgi:hypothetical protein
MDNDDADVVSDTEEKVPEEPEEEEPIKVVEELLAAILFRRWMMFSSMRARPRRKPSKAAACWDLFYCRPAFCYFHLRRFLPLRHSRRRIRFPTLWIRCIRTLS